MTTNSPSPGRVPQKVLDDFNQRWIQCLAILRVFACILMRRFPFVDVDELLNESYVRMIHKLKHPGTNPLDLSRLIGYARRTIHNVVFDSLRRARREQRMKKDLGDQLVGSLRHLARAAKVPFDLNRWRRRFREALQKAWRESGLSLKDREVLRVFLIANTSRNVALELLGLSAADPNRVSREFDQPRFRALRKIRTAFRAVREIAKGGEQLDVAEELSQFLRIRLGLSSPPTKRRRGIE
ncbi:MAG: sigma-70 family RNA polymerase sigma factor [Planctomycetaceae bacterium]|nr:sigma-70 family RNA polymerase sigma factor [Planctomycetaceae bacterium]